MSERTTINVVRCARCGGDHEQITFKRFTDPPPDGQYWAMCPALHEPILMAVIERRWWQRLLRRKR